MRIVGLDVGERRIGVAVSDSTATLARPVGVLSTVALDERAVEQTANEIVRLTDGDAGIAAIVVGLPRRLDGSPSPIASRIESFAASLGARLSMPVVFQDERLTSHEADMRLAEREKDWRARKKRLDAAAAAIILQDYLDSRPPAERPIDVSDQD